MLKMIYSQGNFKKAVEYKKWTIRPKRRYSEHNHFSSVDHNQKRSIKPNKIPRLVLNVI